MKLYFYTEDRLIRGKGGIVYTPNGMNTYNLLKSRYLKVFSEVIFVARTTEDSDYNGEPSKEVEGDNVKVFPLPYYVGPRQYLKVKKKLQKSIKSTINGTSAYILRVPGTIGWIAQQELQRKNINYSIEVVGDPFEVFSIGGVKHPFRVLFKYYGCYKLKTIAKHAYAASYVTKEYLQQRYPINSPYSHYASNVNIKKEAIAKRIKNYYPKDIYTILTIGSLEQMYKAPDIVLKSISLLRNKGINCRLQWVGEGRYREEMEQLASDMNISDIVDFLGFIADRNKITNLMDNADFFILASRTEGLPRVIPEAFARGLPVIGTRVGGIPELIEESLLIDANDSYQLSSKINWLINNLDLAEKISERNLKKAWNYTYETINDRRIAFYKDVKYGYEK